MSVPVSPHEVLEARKILLNRELDEAETVVRNVVVELRRIEKALEALGEEIR